MDITENSFFDKEIRKDNPSKFTYQTYVSES